MATALKIARGALAASIVIFATMLLLGALNAGEWAFVVAIAASIGMALSSFACVLLQLGMLMSRRAAR